MVCFPAVFFCLPVVDQFGAENKTCQKSGLLPNPPRHPPPGLVSFTKKINFDSFFGNFLPFLDPKIEVWFLLPSENPSPDQTFYFFSPAPFPYPVQFFEFLISLIHLYSAAGFSGWGSNFAARSFVSRRSSFKEKFVQQLSPTILFQQRRRQPTGDEKPQTSYIWKDD